MIAASDSQRRFTPAEQRLMRRWEHDFRAAAIMDGHRLFRDHLAGLPDLALEPERLVETTIELVRASCAYAALDCRDLEPFLALQTYDPAQARGAVYSVTFDLHTAASARVLTDEPISIPDFADLYGHPWSKALQGVGYNFLWIARVDGADLTEAEMRALAKRLEDDIYYDYDADEVVVAFLGPGLSPKQAMVAIDDPEVFEPEP